jgi:hypothetical protein
LWLTFVAVGHGLSEADYLNGENIVSAITVDEPTRALCELFHIAPDIEIVALPRSGADDGDFLMPSTAIRPSHSTRHRRRLGDPITGDYVT